MVKKYEVEHVSTNQTDLLLDHIKKTMTHVKGRTTPDILTNTRKKSD